MNDVTIRVSEFTRDLLIQFFSALHKPGAITYDIACEGYLLLAFARRNFAKISTKKPGFKLTFNPGEAKAMAVILPRIAMPEMMGIMRDEFISYIKSKN